MPKKIRNYPVYLAPYINSWRNEEGETFVIDEKAGVRLDPNRIDDKIKIYERQVKGWFLDCANRFKKGKSNGFIILMIAVSYIEGVQQYMNGLSSRRRSSTTFVQGLRRLLPEMNVPENQAYDFYSEVRCGLFHNGMSGGQVVISSEFSDVIDFSELYTIKINPTLLLSIIREDFRKYIASLKNTHNHEMRQNFDSMFSNL